MAKQWHISIAKYNPDTNGVKEKRLRDFGGYESALKAFNKRAHLPIVLWHDNAVNLDNPYFAMIESQAYKEEYKKIID